MRVGIVVPCYNEETRLNVDYWHRLINKMTHVDWIFVDDGSKDKTLNVIRTQFNFENVTALALEENQGKSEAVRNGMLEFVRREKSYSGIGFLDSDAAFSDTDVKHLIELCAQKFTSDNQTFEAVISSRVKLAGRSISRNTFRHYISRIILTFINWNWREAPYDTQSGYKIFRNTTQFKQALEKPFRTKWFIDVELFARIGAMNGRNQIWEEPVQSWIEVPGSKIRIKTSIKIIRDVYLIKKIVNLARRNV